MGCFNKCRTCAVSSNCKNYKTAAFLLVIQLAFCIVFALFTAYGSISSGALKHNSYDKVHGGELNQNVLKKDFYSINIFLKY